MPSSLRLSDQRLEHLALSHPSLRASIELVGLLQAWRRGDRPEAAFRAGLVAAFATAAGWHQAATAADLMATRLQKASASRQAEGAALDRLTDAMRSEVEAMSGAVKLED